jgi:hypothetical protein
MEGWDYHAHCAHYSLEGFAIIKLIAKLEKKKTVKSAYPRASNIYEKNFCGHTLYRDVPFDTGSKKKNH